ncbi:cytochrome P450 [Streptomyces eurocidicus]|uniref:cytochrome P450 n=2 Tax=Streptomyces eurocidicus TaxID=66423 RepID=UPI002892BA5D|nr:cytochrome P450 [Streptomyces eurocidicus]
MYGFNQWIHLLGLMAKATTDASRSARDSRVGANVRPRFRARVRTRRALLRHLPHGPIPGPGVPGRSGAGDGGGVRGTDAPLRTRATRRLPLHAVSGREAGETRPYRHVLMGVQEDRAIRATKSARCRLPPGPAAPSLVQSVRFLRDPYAMLAGQHARFGDTFTLRVVGVGTLVMVSDPEGIRDIVTAPPDVLAAGRARGILDVIYGTRSLLTLDGGGQAWQRRFLMPLFHRSHIAHGQQLALEATREAMATWPADRPFPLVPRLMSITTDILVQKFLKADRHTSLRVKELLLAFIEAAHQPLVFHLPQFPPALAVGPWRRYGRTRDRLDTCLRELCATRRTSPRTTDDDLVTALLRADGPNGAPLDDETLRDILVVVLGSGAETVTYSLAWAMEAVLAHQEAADRARAELRHVTEGSPLTVDHLPRLPYLMAAVTEALRLYPINPIVLRRVLGPGFTVAGFPLPAGVHVAVNGCGAHRRAVTYPDPCRFRPERWLGKGPAPYTWVPFGGGARKCIAAHFAVHELQAMAASLLLEENLRLVSPAVSPGRLVGDMIVPSEGTIVTCTPRTP